MLSFHENEKIFQCVTQAAQHEYGNVNHRH